ncbi:MAG: phosphatase PAP2 family protein [Ruminococcus sp.]|nr:phosphatase PAP2 family protein [Ruminococcus sp.]
MPVITHLGSAGIIWILWAFVLICIRKYRICGIKMLAGMFTGLIIGNFILKNLVARDRPCWIDTDILMLISVPQDYSFPSGHTLASTISAVILMQEDKKLGIPAVILAVLIAFSRMYLFVHFPTDILGGLILGLIIGFSMKPIWNKISDYLQKRKASS